MTPLSSQAPVVDGERAAAMQECLNAQFSELYMELLERSNVCLDVRYREELRIHVFSRLMQVAVADLREWEAKGGLPPHLPDAIKAMLRQLMREEIEKTA